MPRHTANTGYTKGFGLFLTSQARDARCLLFTSALVNSSRAHAQIHQLTFGSLGVQVSGCWVRRLSLLVVCLSLRRSHNHCPAAMHAQQKPWASPLRSPDFMRLLSRFVLLRRLLFEWSTGLEECGGCGFVRSFNAAVRGAIKGWNPGIVAETHQSAKPGVAWRCPYVSFNFARPHKA